MKILLIDTTSENSFISLQKKEGIPSVTVFLPGMRDQSKHLLPLIEKLLLRENTTISDLDLIALAVGPGSFTGIRIGAITAKAFSFTHQIPLLPISSLYTLTPETECNFIALIDAKSHGIHMISGKKDSSKILYLDSPQLISKDIPNSLHTSKCSIITRSKSLLNDPLLHAKPPSTNLDSVFQFIRKQEFQKKFTDYKNLPLQYIHSPG